MNINVKHNNIVLPYLVHEIEYPDTIILVYDTYREDNNPNGEICIMGTILQSTINPKMVGRQLNNDHTPTILTSQVELFGGNITLSNNKI